MDAETLAEYRKRQEEKYKQRLEEEERAARAKEDEEVAAKLQADEQARAETAYATDEELARQLHEQMNAEQAPGQEDVVRAPDSDEVRAPLRTGYMEQLVPDQPHPNMNQTAGLFGWGGNGDQGQRSVKVGHGQSDSCSQGIMWRRKSTILMLKAVGVLGICDSGISIVGGK
uniref:Uncharacterized protein n=1 Tax=Chromera velia CCMP2878 TaxID=1169474 RepID=A0A0G4IA58_9ALVE|mmetsp:Transcript_54277/g.106200  ORF Transcript_54277/g.106200 Transcript_54277/m.106200 type:complete len:172 (+) Transcript_54277:154-669(+)|eukprot:Cvel_12462.t1-p1 / transcript=Cvel_12462.t1 / gene=Cvel_12462 / organism=Chromera_velia_CCMP2878 / gene_product=hypothetical protein / transcript_product=hypothetical protein / location=Cvel_scaffold817:871-1503(-) / protein_length=171 / sequence_SO=supercontig / SO=protein_coding / is_pseudo=false